MSSWSAPPPFPRARRDRHAQPCGQRASGGPRGAARWAGGALTLLKVGVPAPRRPPTLSLFPVSQVGMSPARALGPPWGTAAPPRVGLARGHGIPSFRAGERDCALPHFLGCPPHPERPPSAGAGLSWADGREARGLRAVTPRWAHGRRTRCPHSRGRGTPFTPAAPPLPLSTQAPCRPRRPVLPPSPLPRG